MMNLNNPGNIKHGPSKWKGMSKEQPHAVFVAFNTPEDGMAAQARLLLNYQSKYNLRTISEIIQRWAPVGKENPHQQEYIRYMAKALGKQPDQYIDLDDYETMRKFVVAMAIFENGAAYRDNPYPETTIRKALLMARIHNVPVDKAPAEKKGAVIAGSGVALETAVRAGSAVRDTLEQLPWIGDVVRVVANYSPLFTALAFGFILIGGGIALYTFHQRQMRGQV